MNRQLRRNVSLARALSKLGYTSRAQAVQLVCAARVTVNDKTVVNPTFRCDLNYDHIAVDGIRLGKKRFVYVIMNKPVGVVTTRSDERGRETVYDLLGEHGRWVFPMANGCNRQGYDW